MIIILYGLVLFSAGFLFGTIWGYTACLHDLRDEQEIKREDMGNGGDWK